MKKLFLFVMILVILLFGAKTIIAVRGDQSALEALKAPLKTLEAAIQKGDPILPKSRLLNVPLINQMDQPRLY
ncbi:hypothetical protein RYX56_25450, partial [Alkalihalophilus lindianensis]